MKFTRDEFLSAPRKAVTLMGMSGVGKTFLGCMLENCGWEHYSCDYLIGSEYLAPDMERELGVDVSDFSIDDIRLLSDFIGRIGDPGKGGLSLEKFTERQRLYNEAECRSLSNAVSLLNQTDGDFICDSTGSICEIEDEDLVASLGRETLFVYIEASADEEEEILRRAIDSPKPLYMPPAQFPLWLEQYMGEEALEDVSGIDPEDFCRWVFPVLFRSRLPKYRRLADMYGVSVPSESFRDLKSEDDFLALVADAL